MQALQMADPQTRVDEQALGPTGERQLAAKPLMPDPREPDEQWELIAERVAVPGYN
jgi:hypothetical protein